MARRQDRDGDGLPVSVLKQFPPQLRTIERAAHEFSLRQSLHHVGTVPHHFADGAQRPSFVMTKANHFMRVTDDGWIQ